LEKLEARNCSKIAAFTPHFRQLDRNIDAKSNFGVNKFLELAHIFLVIEMIRSFLEGERTMAKAAKKAAKKATAKRAPAKKAAAKKPAKKAAKKKRAA
jgi:topoisomerase IA-like protein